VTPPARPSRDDTDALDPVDEAEDEVGAEAEVEEPQDETDLVDPDEPVEDELDAAVEAEDDGDDDEVVPQTGVVLPDAEFDDDGEELVTAVVVDDDDDDTIDGVRDGEFVCRSCFMAKREIQLADADRLLCRDCA
jgi:hypothetical protein